MLSTPSTIDVAVTQLENEIFNLHLQRAVLVQIEASIDLLVMTTRTAASDVASLAQAVQTLRAHRRVHQSKTHGTA